jgi:hypothetical protein
MKGIVFNIIVLCALAIMANGCGTNSGNSITPPENPTPPPDPDSMIEFGGDTNGPQNTRPLQR